MRSQEADDFILPALVLTPHPPDNPDRAVHRSVCCFPFAVSTTEPHWTNAPSEPHPPAAPRPSRRSPGSTSTSRSVSSISSSVDV
ncbi:hypothetical protein BJF90_09145 [Pseudonocardia sp. CNS-004]|nr:hypothetical protein BJF90_09145 [Pseudonocardia sp. CNS-004]